MRSACFFVPVLRRHRKPDVYLHCQWHPTKARLYWIRRVWIFSKLEPPFLICIWYDEIWLALLSPFLVDICFNSGFCFLHLPTMKVHFWVVVSSISGFSIVVCGAPSFVTPSRPLSAWHSLICIWYNETRLVLAHLLCCQVSLWSFAR